MTIVDDAAASGGRYVGSFNAGDHLAYSPVNFLNITGVKTIARGDGDAVAALGRGRRAGVRDGHGQQHRLATVTHDVRATSPAGTGKLYVTSNGGVQLDALEFVGDGISDKIAADGHGDAHAGAARTGRTAGTRATSR